MFAYFRKYYDADGGSGSGNTQTTTNSNAGGQPSGLPQEEVNRLVGNARTEGRASAEKALLEGFGVKSLDEIKEIIQTARKAEDANKTELQRLQDQAQTAESKLTKSIADHEATVKVLQKQIVDGEIKLLAAKPVMDKEGKKVLRAAFRQDALDDVTVLIDRSKIEVKDGAVTGVDAALEELAKKKAYLLGTAAPAPTPRGTPEPSTSRSAVPEPKSTRISSL